MRLSVGYNWDKSIITELSKIGIYEIFAAPAISLFGCGRGINRNNNPITFDEMKKHVNIARTKGLRFNFLLNSSYISPRVQDDTILDYLMCVEKIEPDIITCVNQRIIKLANENIKIPIKISINAHLNTSKQIKDYLREKVIRVNVDTNVNRNINQLLELKQNTDVELELLVNQGCLASCQKRDEHNIIASKISSDFTDSKTVSTLIKEEYNLLKECHLKRISMPFTLLSSPWIRPEDLVHYEKLGYDLFKIAGRMKSSVWILNTAKAYSQKNYKGNLLDLICLSREEIIFGKEKQNGYEINNRVLSECDFINNIFTTGENSEFYKSIEKRCVSIKNRDLLKKRLIAIGE